MIEGVFLLTGSNLGDSAQHLRQAAHYIAAQCGVVVRQSAVYQTAAWGKEDQQDFLNQVLQIDTTLSAEALLAKVLAIEQNMGRVRKEKWGERLIDIDLLYFHQQIISEPHLQIPHPGIALRRFVLEPLTEIAPDFIHPVLLKNNRELLASCTDTLAVAKLHEAE
jgi:2-amino-4-hydroxy-6-hydroxymethyldihydropteridine diphosphokinase